MSRLQTWPPIPPERRTNFEWKVEAAWTEEGLSIEVTESYCDSEDFRRKSSLTWTSYLRAPREQLVAALALALASSTSREDR